MNRRDLISLVGNLPLIGFLFRDCELPQVVHLFPGSESAPPSLFRVQAATPLQAVQCEGIPKLHDCYVVVSLTARQCEHEPNVWTVEVRYDEVKYEKREK